MSESVSQSLSFPLNSWIYLNFLPPFGLSCLSVCLSERIELVDVFLLAHSLLRLSACKSIDWYDIYIHTYIKLERQVETSVCILVACVKRSKIWLVSRCFVYWSTSLLSREDQTFEYRRRTIYDEKNKNNATFLYSFILCSYSCSCTLRFTRDRWIHNIQFTSGNP